MTPLNTLILALAALSPLSTLSSSARPTFSKKSGKWLNFGGRAVSHPDLQSKSSPAIVALDARGLPITATTTLTVDVTSTYTVWNVVQPTGGQVVVGGGSGGDAGVTSAAATAAASAVSSVETQMTSAGVTDATFSSSATGYSSVIPGTAVTSTASILDVVPTAAVSTAGYSANSSVSSTYTSAAASATSIFTNASSDVLSVTAFQTAVSSYIPVASAAATNATSSGLSASVSATSLGVESVSGHATDASYSTGMTASATLTAQSTASASSISVESAVSSAASGINSTAISATGAASASTLNLTTATVADVSSVATASITAGISSAISSAMTEFASSSATASASVMDVNSTMDATAMTSAVTASASAISAESAATSSVSSAISSMATSSVSASSAMSSSITVVSSSATLSVAAVSTSVTSTFTSQSTSASASASATTSAAVATGSGLSTTTLSSRMVAAYYPDWTVSQLPPADIDWDLFDCVDFAFALPNSNFGLTFTQWNSETSLTELVAYGHAAGKKVRLSIGGWTGSVYFSDAVSTAANRATFAANILATYTAFDLDGIDIDWEYPGVQGAGTNIVTGSDSANFLLFLNTLRATLPSTAILSAATQVWPFADSSGNPMSDVSGFAKVLDWVLVMNYDIWGSSPTPGPNAPLSDGCGDSEQPLANAYAAVSSWTTAGMPASQIMLGIPAYGYLQISSATALVDRKRSSDIILYNADGGSTNGQLDFDSMVSQGALVLGSDGTYSGAGGFVREWDSCSSTPWLKSTSSGQIVTYDDPVSLSLKAQFARQAGLRGTNMWDMAGDTSNWALTQAVRSGLGL